MPDGTSGAAAYAIAPSASPRWAETVLSVAARTQIGVFEWEMRDGTVHRFEGSEPGPTARVIIRDDRFFGRVVREGPLGFCEGYVDGMWDTPDLQAVLDVALLNNERVARGFAAGGAIRAMNRFFHWLRANSRSGARKNIAAHYDLSNAFYERWLDPSMTYSSALFDEDGQTLEDAQREKYRSICDRMDLQPGDRVLEIGCGWGGFAEYAAKERGARVTGLTLSPAQLDYARKRIERAGVSDRVELALRDYRDERGVYDRIASIEMFEAVGEKYWPTYFGAVRDRLRSGGRASIQTITIADHLFARYRRSVDFIQKHVFPGGMLPSPSTLEAQVDRARLELVDTLNFGESYSKTLRIWHQRFNQAWPEIRSLEGARPFDDHFHRLWNTYLTSCASVFHARTGDVTQVAIARP